MNVLMILFSIQLIKDRLYQKIHEFQAKSVTLIKKLITT